MKTTIKILECAIAGLIVAAILLLMTAAPGFLSGSASTIRLHRAHEAVR